jgi:hypothetical protein
MKKRFASGLMNNRRGLSDVIATVLIILLVLAAVVIIWAFVRPAIQIGAEKVSAGCVELDLKVVSCKHNSGTPQKDGTCIAGLCPGGASECGTSGGTCVDAGTAGDTSDDYCTAGVCVDDTECGTNGPSNSCDGYEAAIVGSGSSAVIERGADNVELNKIVVVYDELNEDGTVGDTKTQDADILDELGRKTVNLPKSAEVTVSGEIVTEAGEVILCDPTALRVDCVDSS